jgi:hypothetical protein
MNFLSDFMAFKPTPLFVPLESSCRDKTSFGLSWTARVGLRQPAHRHRESSAWPTSPPGPAPKRTLHKITHKVL